LGRVTVLPQLKVDRLCSVVDGTADFDPMLPSKVLNGSHRIPFNPQVLGSRYCALS
jgi:hypothetical protein